jgi:predicted ArsR family transcriptional regulator
MNNKSFKKQKQRRRQFMKLLSAGSLFCLGCGHLCALPQSEEKTPASAKKHKFQDDAKMTFEQVFAAAYQSDVQIMNILAEKIGKEKFITMLKDASAETTAAAAKQLVSSLPKNDLAGFVSVLKKPDYFWKHALTFEIVEDTPTTFEVKVTECIWAKTFHDFKAPDIGYAMVCHSDFAMAQAYNPKMKLTRTKTLMQGHDCCNHRYVMET